MTVQWEQGQEQLVTSWLPASNPVHVIMLLVLCNIYILLQTLLQSDCQKLDDEIKIKNKELHKTNEAHETRVKWLLNQSQIGKDKIAENENGNCNPWTMMQYLTQLYPSTRIQLTQMIRLALLLFILQ